MKRAVYSALIGNYERLLPQPAAVDSDIEFLLFTDSRTIDTDSNWSPIRVEPRFESDSVRSARYLKIVGHPSLNNYDETLWIDNRVILRRGFESIFDLNTGYDMSIPIHSFREELREEFIAVLSMGFDDPARVRQMYAIARSAKLDSSQTLWTGLLVRKRNPTIENCMRVWMDYLLLTSRRDQLSINLAIRETSPSVNYMPIENWHSEFHDWTSSDQIQRKARVQKWRSERVPLGLRVGDRVRALPNGHKIARALSRAGLHLPTLPN
ncbi:hypothetical protein MN2019_25980 [Mycolicibacterium neoaurum]|uniref:hypothetical protein n=1 Tax=Mycolicibacterium neoaurum TaxID=1795 RepID=UPI001BCB740B|nr:hypothetical protein [Mycolicibacterium neoaurum]QVI27583.1 hypothetical protein MN2019_25980 [Mycolicibacterium neoaurum]